MGENSITYEELFELLRRERNSEELQTLDPNFYPDLIDYFKDKQEVIDDKSEEAQIFGSSEKEKIRVQLDNAKKIAKELVERREKKIIMLALNKARTESDIIDTSSLLDVEKEFFHEAAALFSSYKKGVLNNIVAVKKPIFGSTVAERTNIAEPVAEEEPDESKDAEELMELEEKESSEDSPSEKIVERVSLKFKSEIPKFMGSDEEVYGPFKPDQVAEVSEEIAQILISKGKAEQVE